ncbi:MAG: thiamine pyrophosphate-dependent dehydrogenase E1 component subunit alpha [Candidatus Acidiferrales bacterium]|jgi:pyruvate dehydrogenase E1 component alpha subunit/2-oxoisovalerate dehydrogenase E1 component alpha subunit
MSHPVQPSPTRSLAHSLTNDQHLDLYYYMQLNRQLEERMVRLFRQNKIVGGLYSSLGQEAVSVGTAYALEPRDWLAPMIRNIGALLVKGFKPRDIFTQHMGKYTSPTQGKDGTSHFGDLKQRHVVSPTSMLGDLIPVMAGVAMGGRYLGQKIVAMTWIGDGGSSTGAFHEGLNLAASQKAPLVVVVENNQWAYSTPVARQVPIRDLANRAQAYGIRGLTADGNDVLAVYSAAKEAVDECRSGRGPVLLEVKTMRMRGHAQHDPAEYVPPAMLDYWKARDPIALFENYLTENNIGETGRKAEIDARIEQELDSDQDFAEQSPLPPPELAEQGVYCEGCHTIEAEWRRPLAEVMPPASSVEAVWTVSDFGAFRPPAALPRPAISVASHLKPATHAAKHIAKPAAKPPEKTHGKPPVALAPEPDLASAPALRVPFGRGPKDRAFRQEQQNAKDARRKDKRGKRR